MHSNCAWDKKCVLVPLTVSHPDSGSIFAYQCVMRDRYNNDADPTEKGKLER